MRKAAAVIVFIGAFAVSVDGQGRGRGNSQGIPPGHLPSPGECRVWYDGRPPGRQPPPTDCRTAERLAARDRSARVIYGASGNRRDDRRYPPQAIPRPYPQGRYPAQDRYPNARGNYRYANVAFDNGYNDGLDKGREDARDNDSYDPNRHGRYRSGDRGYDRRYGSKQEYQDIYREGFRAGYDDSFRGADRRSGGGWRGLPWPF
jgi:hypothetical protein